MCVVALLFLTQGWSASARIGPSIIGGATLAILAGVVATSGYAALRTPAGLPGQGFRTASRGTVILSLIAGYIVLSSLIGLQPSVLFIVPAVFVVLGGRLGWACAIFTIAVFAFTVGLFEFILAVPWPRPVFPVLQDFIFDFVR